MAVSFPFQIKIKGVDEISGMLGSIQAKVENVGKSMQRLGQNLTFKVSAPLAAFGGLAVRQAGNLEQLRIAFGTMQGSAEAGAQTLQDLIQFTAKTPFELPGVAEAARSLLVSGVAAEDLIPTLSTIGDVAAGVGARLEDVALPYWQILQLGKAQLVDLKQLSTQGVPILKKLADTYDTTVETILKAVSAGEISAEIFTQAFKDMTTEGNMFFQASQKQSLSIFGLFSTLKDNTMFALAAFGQEIVDALDVNQLITELTDSVQNLVKWFTMLPAPVKEFAVKLGVVAALVGPIITSLGFMAFGLNAMIGLFATVSGAMAGFGAGAQIITMIGNWAQLIGFLVASNPIIAGVILGIIVGFRYLGSFFQGLFDTLGEMFHSLFGDSTVSLINNLMTSIQILANLFGSLFKAISQNEIVMGIFYELGKAVGILVGGPFLVLLRVITAILDTLLQAFNIAGKLFGLDYKPVSADTLRGAQAFSGSFDRGAVDFSNRQIANPVSQVEVTFSNVPDGTQINEKKGTGLKGIKVGKAMPGI